jgi:hypothetical protein
MITFSFQPLLALSADEQAVLANPVVTWAAVLAKFAFGMLDPVSRRYHAAAREFNLRKAKGRAGRPRARLSAEMKAAKERVEAPAGVVRPEDSVALGPDAHPATTGRSPKPFHSMAIAFLATAIDDKPAAPEHVHRMLNGNAAGSSTQEAPRGAALAGSRSQPCGRCTPSTRSWASTGSGARCAWRWCG